VKNREEDFFERDEMETSGEENEFGTLEGGKGSVRTKARSLEPPQQRYVEFRNQNR
jgi:hypothetical protein